MSVIKDMSDLVFGKLTVIKHDGFNKARKAMWLCRCECGTLTTKSGQDLRRGQTKSCGCLQEKVFATKHGGSALPEYQIWKAIKRRCYNQNTDAYKDYGGRGIVMSDEWMNNFETFYQDMGPRPSPVHSVNRKNNDGNYNKENCEWSTPQEQSNNQRTSVYYEIHGETLTLAQIARKYNVKKSNLHLRLKTMSPEDAVLPINGKRVTIDGKTETLSFWCELFSISIEDVRAKLMNGDDIIDIFKSF